jgi:N-formylglutamate amidohydrolase
MNAHLSLLVGLALVACGGGGTEPVPNTPAAMTIVSGSGERATVATAPATAQVVRVTDAAGRPVAGANITFTVTAGGGWTTPVTATTDGSGLASTTWYLGPRPGTQQSLRAQTGAVEANFNATADPLVPGTRYTGALQYVDFTAGTLPVIVSAPHGGTLQPASIPNRTGPNATTVRDTNTELLAEDIHAAFATPATGSTPHTIIVRLHRVKLDANREVVEAAEGNPIAERTWREYHGFIDAAREAVLAQHGRGFYIDLHGHGHPIQRLELGYMLTASDLAGTDAALNTPAMVTKSSVRTLAETGLLTHAEVVRGPHSLGTLLEGRGFPTVPSTQQPSPGSDPYFSGGYNTGRHGSRNGGTIDGVQIEANMTGVRDTQANRRAFAAALADAMVEYVGRHYGSGPGTTVEIRPIRESERPGANRR